MPSQCYSLTRVSYVRIEEEFAGSTGHLRRWLLPSVGKSWWGPGRAGSAQCSSTGLLWHRDETLHRATRLHVALTRAAGRICTHKRALGLGQLQSISSGPRVLTQPTFDTLMSWTFVQLFLACHRTFMGGFIKKSINPLWFGREPRLQCWRGG